MTASSEIWEVFSVCVYLLLVLHLHWRLFKDTNISKQMPSCLYNYTKRFFNVEKLCFYFRHQPLPDTNISQNKPAHQSRAIRSTVGGLSSSTKHCDQPGYWVDSLSAVRCLFYLMDCDHGVSCHCVSLCVLCKLGFKLTKSTRRQYTPGRGTGSLPQCYLY